MSVNNYIIVSEKRGPSPAPHKHRTQYDAMVEAKRLAAANPGQVFTVYASFCNVVSESVKVTPMSSHYDDEIPF